MTTTRLPLETSRDHSRVFDEKHFDRCYDDAVVGGPFQEETSYYKRYQSRYRHVLRHYASITGPGPVDVCEIGGGQHALLASELWGDLDGESRTIRYYGKGRVVWGRSLAETLAALNIPKDFDYERGLVRLERAGAIVSTVETALFELLRRAGTPEFKAVQKLIL